MDRSIDGGADREWLGRHGRGRADLAMGVLQYGMAIVAIVAVTLLAVVR